MGDVCARDLQNLRWFGQSALPPVTLEEVLGHFCTLEQDSECPDHLDVLLDLTQMESLPETHEISRIVTEMKRVRERVRFGACAIRPIEMRWSE